MAFPNLSDIAATTIERRSRKIADNVTKNNAVLTWLKKSGNIKTVSGGSQIVQEFNFAENGNFLWYSGYDQLNIAAQDVISGATYPFRQAACAVVISGLEQIQNSGPDALIDLMEGRIQTAESTMANKQSEAIYSDGTGYGNKQVQGLQAAIPDDPTTGTYGGIDRSTSIGTFWRSQVLSTGGVPAVGTIQGFMNQMWVKGVRGSDRFKLILADSASYLAYLGSLQQYVRFTSTETADIGFTSLKYMDADVVLDGGIGGFAPTNRMYFLNPKYLFYRPHAERNMVPLSPNKRVPINQDAEIQVLAWAGNITCSGAQFQGILRFV